MHYNSTRTFARQCSGGNAVTEPDFSPSTLWPTGIDGDHFLPLTGAVLGIISGHAISGHPVAVSRTRSLVTCKKNHSHVLSFSSGTVYKVGTRRHLKMGRPRLLRFTAPSPSTNHRWLLLNRRFQRTSRMPSNPSRTWSPVKTSPPSSSLRARCKYPPYSFYRPLSLRQAPC
jgi:hypothetical protein